ncbi:hypothetical protein GN244_ATG09917 [Phytophthora infestans]|uniref:Uncharacterized protein n=1 Tax=Phytophthora infestans TaxID=4787 RepID=A0A833T701_PHYIN|nr:hypothetical protein GN244_ATG09917 [Phytophthora infestans]KAF4129480.1 hypothetical protein GN958_ATG21339 [Phytophthora infestans]
MTGAGGASGGQASRKSAEETNTAAPTEAITQAGNGHFLPTQPNGPDGASVSKASVDARAETKSSKPPEHTTSDTANARESSITTTGVDAGTVASTEAKLPSDPQTSESLKSDSLLTPSLRRTKTADRALDISGDEPGVTDNTTSTAPSPSCATSLETSAHNVSRSTDDRAKKKV